MRQRVRVRTSLRGGFTLIEAIVALVIVGSAVPPMLVAMRDATSRRVSVVQATRARWLAVEQIEAVLADRHSSTRGYAWVSAGNYPAEASVAGFVGFSRSVAVVETGATLTGSGVGFKTVTVTVSWTDGTGTAQSVALSTVVTDYTP